MDLMRRDARQVMMNKHIRLGKRFPEISRLLLCSFGLQDQEFIVVCEAHDLIHFSDPVQQLHGTEGRRYTRRDAPLHTAVRHPAQEMSALWRSW
jgi:chlorite dismutase